jgi:hypothetical protein
MVIRIGRRIEGLTNNIQVSLTLKLFIFSGSKSGRKHRSERHVTAYCFFLRIGTEFDITEESVAAVPIKRITAGAHVCKDIEKVLQILDTPAGVQKLVGVMTD